MAKYFARSCPRCSGYVGIVMRKPASNISLQAINGRCLMCGYRLAWILVQGREVDPAGWHGSSFIPLRLFYCALAARNAPKADYCRLSCTNVFACVVAHSIQDLSELPITYKTGGIRLPRLRYGAIGWRTRLSTKSDLVQSWAR